MRISAMPMAIKQIDTDYGIYKTYSKMIADGAIQPYSAAVHGPKFAYPHRTYAAEIQGGGIRTYKDALL